MRRYLCIPATILLALVLVAAAQPTLTRSTEEPILYQAVSQIKEEGTRHSQIMETLSYLTDVYGPRLTSSPLHRKAAEWARDKLTEWGLENARIEPFGEFGRGWSLEYISIHMLEPSYAPIVAHAKAWTAGTDGTLVGAPMLIDIKSEKDFETYRGKLKDAIILVRGRDVSNDIFKADATRHDKETLENLAMAPMPRAGGGGNYAERIKMYRARRALQEKINDFLLAEGAGVILESSPRDLNTLHVGSGGSREKDGKPGIAQAVIAVENFNRIIRIMDKDIPVKLEVTIRTKFHDEDLNGFNVTAEIPGTDPELKDELVMVGGHFDSWHSGTGATDNAAGSAVGMEAVRIIMATGLKPRRTIRIALWGGEEQGLLGSRAYVKENFGNPETMELKPAHEKFSSYFNLDNGSGQIRGIYMQSNDAVRPIFEAWFIPFHEYGARTLSIRNTGGTDHLAFDAVGLPGFQFIQEPLAYSTRTHHTSLDVYEQLQAPDMMRSAVIMASFIYHAAMREEKLPRKVLPKPQSSNRH